MNDHDFRLHETGGIRYYSCKALDRIPGLRHGFSTRHGGASLGPDALLNLCHVSWDSPAHVLENRRRFLAALDLTPENLATVSQIHSADFHIIQGPAHQWNPHTRGDAIVTETAGVALAVQVADCFPVLLSDPRSGSIAAVHAGWRGSLARIVQKTLEGMRLLLGADPADVWAAIGPGIRPCCLEVGPEVAFPFETAFPGANLIHRRPGSPDRYLLDLPRALKIQLSQAGVPAMHAFDLEMCTRCRTDEFFSYRAEEARSGRMMGVISRLVNNAD